MTDHRPEVRECLEKLLVWLTKVPYIDAQGQEHKSFAAFFDLEPFTVRINEAEAALSAPPIEPVGMREACIEFGKLIQREAQMRHGWENYTGQQVIELVVKWWFEKQPWGVAAALAACDKPVEEVTGIPAHVVINTLEQWKQIYPLPYYRGDRVRLVVYKERP